MSAAPLIIGVTGMAGSGKTACLEHLKSRFYCRVISLDRVAEELEKKGGACFDELTALLGENIIGADGEIDRKAMSAKIFADGELLKKVNSIVHPAVRIRVDEITEACRSEGKPDFLFIEAALLIESGYEEITDEMWYVYADEDVRRKRLKEIRGYTDERINGIIKSQLSDEEFRRHCAVVIDNSGDFEDTKRRLDILAGERICGTKRAAN